MLDYIKFRNDKELFDQFLFQINTSHIIQINTRLVQVISNKNKNFIKIIYFE